MSYHIITVQPEVTIIVSDLTPTSTAAIEPTFSLTMDWLANFYDPSMILLPRWKGTVSKPIVVQIAKTEIQDVFKGETIQKILQERNIGTQKVESLKRELLKYIEKEANERGVILTDKVKESLANLMVLVAQKIDQET